MGKRKMFLRFAGLGDDLFVNTVAYHYWRENKVKPLVGVRHRELIRGNPGALVLPTGSHRRAHKIGRVLEELGVIDKLTYMEYNEPVEFGVLKPMGRHIFTALAEKAELQEVPEYPVIFLDKDELDRNELPSGSKPWVAIHSTGVTEMTANKNWYPERYVELSRAIRKTCRLVQLGLPSDPSLNGDLDLRGKISPREAAAVLSSADAVVCQVGYLMHAAAAVGTRAVVIYGGFEAPWESGYDRNINLFTPLACSPCWIRKLCPYDKECMKQISVGDVLAGLDQILSDHRGKVP